jgi:NAD(P)-dependent dehydrogenase (short-subunit alcohol dehydrogenase family)
MSRVWLITGSAHGLGRALAETVLAAGHCVVATARRPDRLEDLRAEHGERFRRMAMETVDARSAETAAHLAVKAFGRVDVAVANGGLAAVEAVEDVSDHSFRKQLESNFFDVVNLARAVLPAMRRQGAGHIIPVSSMGGRNGMPGLAAYQSARWAVEGFCEVLAQEVAPFGIKVSVIEPGGPRTGLPGAPVSFPPISEPYQATVGVPAGGLRARLGRAPADPVKAAAAILGLTYLQDPPLHLVLGRNAGAAVADAGAGAA